MLTELKFRVAEKLAYGGKKTFTPQVQEEEVWYDIDYMDDDFIQAGENYGDTICETMEDAVKVIHDFFKMKKEEFKDKIKDVTYHPINIE